MDKRDVPQDNSQTYNGHRKVIYATDNGHYVKARSSGWQDEAFATEQAVSALQAQTEAARAQVYAGECSPLYYYMHHYRYDLKSLAQTTGLFQWQIRRHFKPACFRSLSDQTLSRYAAAFNLDIAAFRQPFDA